MAKTATLTIDGKSYTFPIVEGSEGEQGIDISNLLESTGTVTLDFGYKNTGATTSAITFLDGDKGILRYRGYSIEDLAAKVNLSGSLLPADFWRTANHRSAKHIFKDIQNHTMVHEDIKKILDGFPSTSHPMGVLASLFCAQTAFYPEALDPNRSSELVYLSIVRSLAKMPTFAAWAYKNEVGHPVNYPDNKLDYCSRFLKMMFALPAENYEVDPVVASALDKLLNLTCRS
jgi:citrate synthase